MDFVFWAVSVVGAYYLGQVGFKTAVSKTWGRWLTVETAIKDGVKEAEDKTKRRDQ